LYQMKREKCRGFAVRSVLFGLAVAAIIGSACARFRHHRPNIVIIVVDALRQDHLPMYGYARNTAPFLSNLAKRSAVFDAMSPTSWTKPAVTSLLTGLHPISHQTFGRTDVVPPEVVTLPQLLAGGGFTSYGVSSNAWISRENGFLRGFSSLDVVLPTGPDSPPAAQQVNLTALRRLRDAHAPFFAYIHYVDTHLPYRPVVSWDGKSLAPADRQHVSEKDLQTTTFLNRSPDVLQRATDLYDGGIRQADAAIEDVFRELRERGVADDTIVIITADHGEEFQEHGRMGHGHSLYQEVTKVPMIVSGPGIQPGVRRGLVSLMDVVPTLADVLELHGGRTFDGISLGAHLANAALTVPDRDLLFHLDYAEAVSSSAQQIPAAALALIRHQSKMMLSRVPFQKSVFDLASDPLESNNRFAENSHLTSALGSALAAQYNELSRKKLRRVTMTSANEMQRALGALGYLTGGSFREPRSIPGGIAPPDPSPDGRLGWLRDVDSCIQTANAAQSEQLLGGWHGAEVDGRWTSGTATVVLPIAKVAATRLTIVGRNAQPGRVHLHVEVGTTPVADKDLVPGPFILNIPLSSYDAAASVTRIVTANTYKPSDFGLPDSRELGVFISSLCVE